MWCSHHTLRCSTTALHTGASSKSSIRRGQLIPHTRWHAACTGRYGGVALRPVGVASWPMRRAMRRPSNSPPRSRGPRPSRRQAAEFATLNRRAHGGDPTHPPSGPGGDAGAGRRRAAAGVLAPRAYGGEEASRPGLPWELVERIARVDGSAGWAAMTLNKEIEISAGYLPAETMRRVCTSPRHHRGRLQGATLGHARRVEGGWRLSGRSPLSHRWPGGGRDRGRRHRGGPEPAPALLHAAVARRSGHDPRHVGHRRARRHRLP